MRMLERRIRNVLGQLKIPRRHFFNKRFNFRRFTKLDVNDTVVICLNQVASITWH